MDLKLLVHGSTILKVLEQGLPMSFCDEHGEQRLGQYLGGRLVYGLGFRVGEAAED